MLTYADVCRRMLLLPDGSQTERAVQTAAELSSASTPAAPSLPPASIRQHASAYVIRQHASAYVCIRQHPSACVSIRLHTSAYVCIRQHTSAYVSIHQHTSAYISIRQHTSKGVRQDCLVLSLVQRKCDANTRAACQCLLKHM